MLKRLLSILFFAPVLCFGVINWSGPTSVVSGTQYTISATEPPTTGWSATGPNVVTKKNGTLFAQGNPTASGSTTDTVTSTTTITYTCVGWSGATSSYTVTITPANQAPFGWIDTVSPNPVSRPQTVTIIGWAVDSDHTPGAPVSRVDVLVDGVVKGTGTLGGVRTDVAAAYGRSDFTNSGWSYVLATSALSYGSHTITVSAVDSLGLASSLLGSKTLVITNGVPTSTLSSSLASIPQGYFVTLTGTSGDSGGDLTSNTVEYLAPGSSTWVAGLPAWGDAGAATNWTGAGVASNTLSFKFTATVAGTFSFRCRGGDQYGAFGGYATTSVVVAATTDTSDFDGDGMPDKWEIMYGLNPTVNDAALDFDGDGLSNLDEYLSGRDPTNPVDSLQRIILKILAPSGSYSVQTTNWIITPGP